MAGTGQTINDRINAVRYALVGQGLARTVCKATTEEVLGPKKKHLDYLLVCTQEPNVSVPQLANLLIERTQHMSWAVVFKGLITIHHLMAFGNERFTQYLATSNHSFSLPDFMDRSTPQGYTMSTFVRRYSKYVNDKCISYRNLAIDICKLGTGNDNPLRTMNMEKLSKTLPIVHEQYDSLLEFEADSKDLNNGIIMAAFRLLYKDLVRLYVPYQEAIINLLERYFKLSRKKTREALELYKQYLNRMDKIASFFKVADAVGLDKSEMPDLTKSPASLLTLLEQHLAQLEAKKKGNNVQGESQAETSTAKKDLEVDEPTTAAKLEQMSITSPTDTLKEPAAASASSSRQSTPEKLHDEQQQAGSSGLSSDIAATSGKSEQKSQPTSPKVPPAPKKPPARPSPVSTSSSSKTNTSNQQQQQQPSTTTTTTIKQTTSSTKIAPTTTQPKSTGPAQVAASTSSVPPERPAKPPSRPPPPSAATGAPASASSGEPSDQSTPVKKANVPPAHPPAPAHKPTSPAPPHPPPPAHMPTHSNDSTQHDSTKTTITTSEQPPTTSTPEPIETQTNTSEVVEANVVREPNNHNEDQQQQDQQENHDDPQAAARLNDHHENNIINNDDRDELRAPIDANNLDRPDSGVGSPSNDSDNGTHSGPTCSAIASELQQQQVQINHQAGQIPNHSGNENHHVNGHSAADQVNGAEAGAVVVAGGRDQPSPPPPPPALDDDAAAVDIQVDQQQQQQQEHDVNHVNNNHNNNHSDEANNGP